MSLVSFRISIRSSLATYLQTPYHIIMSDKSVADVVLQWLESPTTLVEDKLAFFEAYDKADQEVNQDCLQIVYESLTLQAEVSQALVEEGERDLEALQYIFDREMALEPGSLSRQILDQAKQDMQDLADEALGK